LTLITIPLVHQFIPLGETMSYYGQQQQRQQQSGSSSSGSANNMFGDMQSSEGRKLYTELTGVDMNTFSNNATFSVPRFLQDNFDPAILHSADNTTAPYPSQSASASSSNPQHAFRDLDMQYNQCVFANFTRFQ
jgi:hypothetical protein